MAEEQYRKELVSPQGDTFISTSPVETNNLMYGHGYREKEEATPRKATAKKANGEESP